MITSELVLQFKSDLWKDQRELEVIERNGIHEALVKSYESHEEAKCEQQVLQHLSSYVGTDAVPELLAIGDKSSTLRYIYGIRIFNLLVELDNAPASFASEAGQLKRQLISRCIARERTIQNALYTLPDVRKKAPYPIEKVRSIIHILAECLGIRWDAAAIDEELNWLSSVWTNSVCVPFRDAAIKNIALASRDLWLGNFKSEDARKAFLYNSISSGASWMAAPIIDYDFCSCIHNTTPEDDLISIKFHERTWLAPPNNADELVWDFAPDARRAAITFFVRFYRFGGRKAAYRLLHSTGHRIRFRDDSDTFYFEKLPEVMKTLWPDVSDHLPGLLEFTEVLRTHLPSARSNTDYFRAIHPQEKRDYYYDLYPE